MSEHTHSHSHVGLYIKVFLALLVLTGVTVAIAYVDLGHHYNDLVAMTVAITKAMLVILFFMHVKESPKLIKVLVSVGFVFFIIMVALTIQDHLTRAWDANPLPLP